jgi:chromosome segregation ATPase
LKSNELEALEQDFREFLDCFSGDEYLEKYKTEYEKLYNTFRMSVEQERYLIRQHNELNEMMARNAAIIKTSCEMSREDTNTIKRLRKEIDSAWNFVERAREKEANSKKMVQNLKGEIVRLNEIVEQGAALSLGPENNVHELIKSKDELSKLNEERREKIAVLEAIVNNERAEQAQIENEVVKSTELLKAMKSSYEKAEMDNKKKEDKIKLQTEQHKNIKNELEKKESEKNKVSKDLEAKQKEKVKLSKTEQNRDAELSEANYKNKELAGYKEDLIRIETKTTEDYNDKKELLLAAERQIAKLNEKQKELKTTIESRKREGDYLEEEKAGLIEVATKLEEEKKLATITVKRLEVELEQLRKKLEEDRQVYQSLMVENNAIRKKAKDAETKNVELEEQIKGQSNEITNCRNELEKKKKDHVELQRQKDRINTERAKLLTRYAKVEARVKQLQEDCKLKDNLYGEIETKMKEYKDKAKEKEQLYEVVRSDRNLYSKNLIEAQKELDELKKKFDITMQQINQLKEELESKDRSIVEKKHSLEIEKQKKQINEQKVMSQKSEIDQLKKMEKEKEVSITKLANMLRVGEGMVKNLQKSYDDAIREKEVFGTELIRRNDELAVLCEKIKILQSTLTKGEVQYRNKEMAVRKDMEEVANQKAIFDQLSQRTDMVSKLKHEIHTLENALTQEKIQVRALSEELENPINVHRWRKMKETDPDTYELLQKIHALQRRLIKKTEEVAIKESELKDREKKIERLKISLARQPGPETTDAIEMYKQNLQEKAKQMEAMSVELQAYSGQVDAL